MSQEFKNDLPELSAKQLVLDLLRMVQPVSMPVSLLVDAGAVFSINENAIRVNIARLLSKNRLEQDERGYYRLGSEAEAYDKWLSAWQAGERRVKPWDGSWLLLNTSRKLRKKEEQAVIKTARHFGFRELLTGSWIRPDNLNSSVDELLKQIGTLSHTNEFYICESQAPRISGRELEIESLWNGEELESQYREMISLLEKGIREYPDLTTETAFRNSYFVGAEIHHRLALDPLLPSEMVDVSARQDVIDMFAEYDACYRPAWIQFFEGYVLKQNKRSFGANSVRAIA